MILSDAKPTLTIPSRDLSSVAESASLTQLASHLTTLSLAGNEHCDSCDIRLTLLGRTLDGFPIIEHPAAVERSNREGSNLHCQWASLIERVDVLEARTRVLEAQAAEQSSLTKLVCRFETYSRVLQGLNDQMFEFARLTRNQKKVLKIGDLNYITKILCAPREDLDDEEEFLVEQLLSGLSTREFKAVEALLPLFHELEDVPLGRNEAWLPLGPIPTINDGISYIKSSTLDPAHKATIIACIKNGMQTSRGTDLFLHNGSSTLEASTLGMEQ